MESDTFTQRGAARLATKIQVYWTAYGLTGVKAWPEPLQLNDAEKTIIWQVRSNVGRLIGERLNSNTSLQRAVSGAVQ